MPLEVGALIGHYEVRAAIGAGGMGEVYRARDTKLHRDVALKVLPETFASDPERRARFHREAEVLAALNHPNVAQVFGVEEADGNMALVMELVDGKSLADRIAERTISVEEALAIARQIADALEWAHQQGVIHRDLKPANVMLRLDGTVKVLDFGLAKWMEPSHADSWTATESLTLPRAAPTESGVILGTAAYMSPEQATGQRLDVRTDVWAFGAVLYEMLTGRRAFDGSTISETLAAVLGGTPDWTRLPSTVSAPVRALLRRCLARDARLRMKNMGAVRFVLDEGDALSVSENSPSTKETAVSRMSAVFFSAAVLSVSAAMAASFSWLFYRPAPSPILRTIIAADTITTNVDRNFAFTPDASRLAYVSSDSRQILVRPLDSLDPVPILTTTAHLRGLFPSPDGRWFGYVENAFTLKKILVAGGPPAIVQQMDGPSRGASWGPDDTIVFATGATGTGLQQVGAGGGPVTVLTRPDRERGEADHVAPVWLPDHRGILFTILAKSGSLDAATVAVLDLKSSEWRTVVEQGYGARYDDGGYLVYGAAGALWATRFDLSRLQTRGAPAPVLQHVSIAGIGGIAHFDIASNGTLLYPRDVPSDGDGLVPVWVDREA